MSLTGDVVWLLLLPDVCQWSNTCSSPETCQQWENSFSAAFSADISLAHYRAANRGHQEAFFRINIEQRLFRTSGKESPPQIRACGERNWICACAGLTSEDEDKDFLLEASQGDRISGKISRKEVARVAAAALGTAASVGESSLHGKSMHMCSK